MALLARWVLVSTLSVGVAFAEGGALSLVIYGAIAGGVVVSLFRQPITEDPSLPQDSADPLTG